MIATVGLDLDLSVCTRATPLELHHAMKGSGLCELLFARSWVAAFSGDHSHSTAACAAGTANCYLPAIPHISSAFAVLLAWVSLWNASVRVTFEFKNELTARAGCIMAACEEVFPAAAAAS